MRYSFPKFSFFIGLCLIGLVCVQTFVPQLETEVNENIFAEKQASFVEEKMCKGEQIPFVYAEIQKKVPAFTSDIALVICLSCLLLTLAFNLLPQKNFFMWTFVHLFTAIFIIGAFFSGYFFVLNKSPLCETTKNVIGGGLMKEGNMSSICEKVRENPYIKKIIEYIPSIIVENAHKYITNLSTNVNKLGVTSPIFLIVIALYLVNQQTEKVTKKQILILVLFIVSIITGVGFFNETKDILMTLGFSLAFILIAFIILNISLKLGYIVLATSYISSSFVIAFRVFSLLTILKVPFAMEIAFGVFIFLFANTIFWTYSGQMLTIIFLLNYGLRQLYPLPVDALVILVFITQIFNSEPKTKQEQPSQKPKAESEKPKSA